MTALPTATRPPAPLLWSRGFLWTAALVALWVNLSEVARYFLVVRPMLKDAFPELPGIAPITVPIFLSWMLWDAVLIAALITITWLYLERFGPTLRNALVAGALTWLFVFGVLWLGLYNLALATPALLAAALPLALLELLIGAAIFFWGAVRWDLLRWTDTAAQTPQRQ